MQLIGDRLKRGDYKYIGSFPHFIADTGDERVGHWLDKKIDPPASMPNSGRMQHRRTWSMSPWTDRKLRVLIGAKPSASKELRQGPQTHSVGSVGDHNLGVVTITDVALKNASAVPPTHFISGAPNTAYVDL